MARVTSPLFACDGAITSNAFVAHLSISAKSAPENDSVVTILVTRKIRRNSRFTANSNILTDHDTSVALFLFAANLALPGPERPSQITPRSTFWGTLPIG